MTNFFKPQVKKKQHQQKPIHLRGTRIMHVVLEECPGGDYHHYVLERDNTGNCIKCGKEHPKLDNEVFERQLK